MLSVLAAIHVWSIGRLLEFSECLVTYQDVLVVASSGNVTAVGRRVGGISAVTVSVPCMSWVGMEKLFSSKAKQKQGSRSAVVDFSSHKQSVAVEEN